MYRENLKKLRFELKLSAQKLADDLGIHKMTISNYENETFNPNTNIEIAVRGRIIKNLSKGL